MSRLDWFTIAVVTICIAAILFLLAKTSSLLNNEDNILTDPTTIVDDVDDSDLDDSDIYTDDTMEPEDDGDDSDPSVSDAEADAAGEDDIDDSSDDDDSGDDDGYTTGKNTDDGASDDEPKVNTSPSGGDVGGDYLVVAGSFQQMINAENFVKKLQGMGYSDATIGKFNAGKYATALAGRYDSRADAQALVDELKGKGIEAYLQIKK